MQADVGRILIAAGIEAVREYQLGDGDRVDFFVPATGTAVECKVRGGMAEVFLQLARYAKRAEVREIVLVTASPAHRRISAVEGKSVEVVYAAGAM
jgi:hypothetical protein